VFEGDPLDVSGKGRAELREKRAARSRKRDDRLMGIRRSHSDDERLRLPECRFSQWAHRLKPTETA
jgi:hypothetical protein